ncbi:MAG: hypothetical protein IPJ81_18490 [Chitinophagaceae bacterium]|nr:hypothetical protein [Chitinophagaceae bacterium]
MASVRENQAFYSRYKFILFSEFTFFVNDDIIRDQIQQAESRNLFGFTSKMNKKYYFGKIQLNSIYNAGIRHDMTTDSRLSNTKKREFLSDIKLGNITEIIFTLLHSNK